MDAELIEQWWVKKLGLFSAVDGSLTVLKGQRKWQGGRGSESRRGTLKVKRMGAFVTNTLSSEERALGTELVGST